MAERGYGFTSVWNLLCFTQVKEHPLAVLSAILKKGYIEHLGQ